jgi:predicted DNA repair protein MutK
MLLLTDTVAALLLVGGLFLCFAICEGGVHLIRRHEARKLLERMKQRAEDWKEDRECEEMP